MVSHQGICLEPHIYHTRLKLGSKIREVYQSMPCQMLNNMVIYSVSLGEFKLMKQPNGTKKTELFTIMFLPIVQDYSPFPFFQMYENLDFREPWTLSPKTHMHQGLQSNVQLSAIATLMSGHQNRGEAQDGNKTKNKKNELTAKLRYWLF